MKYDDYEVFFDCVGDQFLHPKSLGENYYSFSVEQMYQFFKQRYEAEKTAEIGKDQ